MDTEPPFVVAAPAHPSLDGAIHRFCDELGAEGGDLGSRRDGMASLVRRLTAPGPDLKLAAIVGGAVVGVARIDGSCPDGPELVIAVAARWRGRGIGSALAQAVVGRAHAAGVPRVVVRTTRHGAEFRAVGAELGYQVFELGGGRADLVRTRDPITRSA
jgi:GNAT superfamily N-acetyltransferase